MRALRRAQIARQKVQIFKPRFDSRYSDNHIVSHSGQKIASQVVATAQEIMDNLDIRTEVIGIDEAQFFDDEVVSACSRIADLGKRVIVAGLDMDFRGDPFGPMPRLLAIAEEVEKVHAICARCGAPASYTQRLSRAKEQVVVGAADIYTKRLEEVKSKAPNVKTYLDYRHLLEDKSIDAVLAVMDFEEERLGDEAQRLLLREEGRVDAPRMAGAIGEEEGVPCAQELLAATGVEVEEEAERARI